MSEYNPIMEFSYPLVLGEVRSRTKDGERGSRFTNIVVRMSAMDMEVAATIGVPGITDGDVQMGGFVLEWELLLSGNETMTPVGDSTIFQREEAGVVVVVTIKGISSSIKLTLPAVAAAAQLKLATTFLTIHTLGSGKIIPAALGSGLPTDVLVQPDGVAKVLEHVATIQKHMAANFEEITPVVRRYNLGGDAEDPLDEAQSQLYALRSIKHGDSLRIALIRMQGRALDPHVVRATYAGIMGAVQMDSLPGQREKDVANRLLD